MGLKNDIKFKILQELMQETNIERPISIWKLRDAVYGEISVAVSYTHLTLPTIA